MKTIQMDFEVPFQFKNFLFERMKKEEYLPNQIKIEWDDLKLPLTKEQLLKTEVENEGDNQTFCRIKYFNGLMREEIYRKNFNNKITFQTKVRNLKEYMRQNGLLYGVLTFDELEGYKTEGKTKTKQIVEKILKDEKISYNSTSTKIEIAGHLLDNIQMSVSENGTFYFIGEGLKYQKKETIKELETFIKEENSFYQQMKNKIETAFKKRRIDILTNNI